MMTPTFVNNLDKALWYHHQPVYLALLRGLATGQPVSPGYLALTAQMTLEEIRSVLTNFRDIEYDPAGNLISAGLSLTPTPHRIWFNDQVLFAWCALDTLMYPVLLQQTAQVESPCPITGRLIRLTVTPTHFLNFDPPEAVVSIVVPACSHESCCTRGEFCNLVHFFTRKRRQIVGKPPTPKGRFFLLQRGMPWGRYSLNAVWDRRLSPSPSLINELRVLIALPAQNITTKTPPPCAPIHRGNLLRQSDHLRAQQLYLPGESCHSDGW